MTPIELQSALIQVRTTSRKRRRRRRVKPKFPRRAEMEYRRLLNKLIDETLSVARDELERTQTVRQDSIQEDIASLFDSVLTRIKTTLPAVALGGELRRIFNVTDASAETEVSKDIARALGIDVITSVAGREDRIRGFVTENVRRINGLQEDMVKLVESEVLRAVADGTNTADLASILARRTRISKNRAKLIARDQVGKVNAELMRERQRSVGITKYRWRTSQDERVRSSHSAREGEVFEWDNAPSDGHPGQPINCRCTAEAVIDL